MALLSVSSAAYAQEETKTVGDTIYNPKIIYSGMPKVYEIADIKVTGNDNFDDNTIISYSGMSVGQRISVPGDETREAVKRIYGHGTVSQAQIKAAKTVGDKIWLEIDVRQHPIVSKVNFIGVKKGEKKELDEKLNLKPGNQFSHYLVDRIKEVAKKYFKEKGFDKASIDVRQSEDLSKKNQSIIDIIVDKHEKIKVHKIYLNGNTVLSDRAIKKVMKKTNENNNIMELFNQKKFVRSDYDADKQRIIDKYNEKGYRDARIVADSVTNYSDNRVDVHITVDEGKKYYISNISWVGNTIYDSNLLNRVLGIHKGDVYNQKLLQKRMQEDDDAVSNLYLDNGYLFFDMVPVETNVKGDSVGLQMQIYEGKQAKINKVVINGNDRLYEKVVRRELRIRPGALFSK